MKGAAGPRLPGMDRTEPRKAGRPELRAAFPWGGGKSLWYAEVNARLGTGPDVRAYIEPFAGSMAVLLSRPPAPREVVCDTDGLLVNAWRSIVMDPGMTACAADWPTFHDDLIARRRWLAEWSAKNSHRLQEDPFYFDPLAGGIWIWVASNAIQGAQATGPVERPFMQSASGGRGCSAQRGYDYDFTRPHITNNTGGAGVQAQRVTDEGIPNHNGLIGGSGVQAQRLTEGGIPMMTDGHRSSHAIGRGVSAQRKDDGRRPYIRDKDTGGRGVQPQGDGGIPRYNNGCRGGITGAGIQATRVFPDDRPANDPGGLPSPDRWSPWFEALARRLKRVIILNRSWESALTPCAIAEKAKGVLAVMMDPPYVMEGRTGIYASDDDGEAVNKVAAEAHAWSVAHGDEHRIAYCHKLGSFAFPDGWHVMSRRYPGHSKPRRERDAVAFSPACLKG